MNFRPSSNLHGRVPAIAQIAKFRNETWMLWRANVDASFARTDGAGEKEKLGLERGE